jgi:acyl-CoA dehydrogenase
MILLNPNDYNRYYPDERSREIMLKTIAFFEEKGLARIKNDDHERIWYQDFIDFVKENNIFAQLLTPQSDALDEHSRWDMWRIQGMNEILGFYGLPYWYTWQVTILGLGPLWMTKNKKMRKQAAELLQKGSVFAFGLSEREHGADVYSTGMTLKKTGEGKYVANGSKYYIGNANVADMVSTFGKMAENGEYVFFVANYQKPNYNLVKNVVNSQNYVGEYRLTDYEVSEDEILAQGSEAWDMALNTVNVGKYNLGWASIGMCTHAFYEAINHAANRELYGMHVTDFPHVKRMFVDAYAKLTAMKLYAMRTADYMRSASRDDRRYLLYDPLVKMKVTLEGEDVVNLLWDVIAAKGFEKDTFFEMVSRDIRALPKLEGTVHVNVALVNKFIQNFLFNPKEYPEIPQRNDMADDEYLFNQGPTHGLGKIQFHDYHLAYDLYDTPNIAIFKQQIDAFKQLLVKTPATTEQQKDIDMMLNVGQLFTLIVYGQLILEEAKIVNLDIDLVDQIFEFMVRDFSKFAVDLYGRQGLNKAQAERTVELIKKPDANYTRFYKIWKEVYGLNGLYTMKP